MSERNIIAIHDVGSRGLAMPVPAPAERVGAVQHDRLGRVLHDLRISVTDRCNFRCSYCMPKEVFDKNHRFLPQQQLLTFEEITRVARLFVELGVRKIRLTGGEPLLRRHIEDLVAQLAALRTPEGEGLDLTLTTNGSLLARKALALRQAGLRRVTVSLDAMDDAIFRRMNDVDFPVAAVLDGIEAAREAGLGPIKVNMVVKRGSNDHEILPMVRHFRERYSGAVVLRFIEYMDVGATNGWRMDEVLPSDEVRRRIDAEYPLVPLEAAQPGETAQRWAFADGRGEVGFISSVTQAFCGDCNRIRLSTEGQLFTCLFAERGHDLRSLLREAQPDGQRCSDGQLAAAIGRLWAGRSDRYSELRAQLASTAGRGTRRVEMSYIGG
ncbi:MAG: GTP 3',8-cyclase MoaA [Burkholderiaceae bacterium]|nr:GTP 3',8-cyclase MoaA [Burkholderiaceae bacterium]